MPDQKIKTIYDTFYKGISYLSENTQNAKYIAPMLRHAISEVPGQNPELYGQFMCLIPADLQGKGINISYEEYALYISLAMYVIGPRENKELTIAEAASIAQIKRQKIVAIESASNIEEFQTELRSLVKLLGSKNVGFNYSQLAIDIYLQQINKINISRKWEREYAQKEIKK